MTTSILSVTSILILLGMAYVISMLLKKHIALAIGEAKDSPEYIQRIASVYRKAISNSTYFPTAADVPIKDFYDADAILCDPKELEKLVPILVLDIQSLLNDHPNAKLAFSEKDSGPIGMISLAGLLSARVGVPFVLIRPRCQIAEMAVRGCIVKERDKVILVQDVVTSGHQVLLAKRVLDAFGVEIIGVVSLFDREGELDKEFSDLHLPVKTLLKRKNTEASPHR